MRVGTARLRRHHLPVAHAMARGVIRYGDRRCHSHSRHEPLKGQRKQHEEFCETVHTRELNGTNAFDK